MMNKEYITKFLATKLDGWDADREDDGKISVYIDTVPEGIIRDFDPLTDIAHSFMVVEAIQTSNPGWRFSLLGGDKNKKGEANFGWSAEFFGHIDPSKNTGQRHGQSHNFLSRPLAISIAAFRALATEEQLEKAGIK